MSVTVPMEVVLLALSILIALQAWTLKQLIELKIKVAVIHSACRICREDNKRQTDE